ncbi:sensor histidine kinase [Dyadobacter alkalitolerans]|uniref:sensor histidine kinase n=1 Tax=Dyadobacter alkalitolerans TaxID=492736 RepID=UPI0004065242|nr:HAMP domain-containing sensor histidine kinase [Dyadobacter alkalitolerans]
MGQVISPAEQKMKAILLHAPVGLVDMDESGKIVSINLMGGKLLNPLAGETLVPGINLYPCLSALDPEIVTRIRDYAEPSGLIMLNQQYSYVNPNSTDGERHFKLTVTKIFAGCVIVSVEDVTGKMQEEQALKQAQQDKAVAQGKYEIASEVIHDIGNAVVGFNSYLTRINRMLEQYNQGNLQKVAMFLKQQNEPLSAAIGAPKAAALIDMLEAICKSLGDSHDELRRSVNEQLHLTTHIQDILNIQRQYISGHESQERKPVNLKDIISDCRSMIFANMEKKGVNLSLSIPSTHIEIKGDRTKLMQVLLNILKNSIEAIDMDAAEKSVTIKLIDSEDSVHLSVTDSGKGFDAQTAKHLFDRGYTTKSTGTGLGLYNCKAIIESHGGSISMESDGVGTGSRTTISIKK